MGGHISVCFSAINKQGQKGKEKLFQVNRCTFFFISSDPKDHVSYCYHFAPFFCCLYDHKCLYLTSNKLLGTSLV